MYTYSKTTCIYVLIYFRKFDLSKNNNLALPLKIRTENSMTFAPSVKQKQNVFQIKENA
jgi:hypothetical protein